MKLLVGLILLPGILCQAPKPCCVGNQFSASLLEIGGQIDPKTGNRSFIDLTADLHYDYDNLKMAVIRHTTNLDGTTDDMHILIDYPMSKMYIKGSDYCIIQNYTGLPLRQPCVPQNSTYLGRSNFGSGGTNIEVDMWSMSFPEMTGKIAVTTDGHCTPVFETELTASQQLTIFMSNVTLSIDKSLFVMPKTCVQI